MLWKDTQWHHNSTSSIVTTCFCKWGEKKGTQNNWFKLSLPSRSVSGMCGMDVDLDDGGTGEEEKDEELWIGEGVKMLPPPVAHSGGSAWGSRRGRCGCVACGAVLILWNLCVILASLLLLAIVFSLVLLPALVLLYVGFLCHSRVSCPKSKSRSKR